MVLTLTHIFTLLTSLMFALLLLLWKTGEVETVLVNLLSLVEAWSWISQDPESCSLALDDSRSSARCFQSKKLVVWRMHYGWLAHIVVILNLAERLAGGVSSVAKVVHWTRSNLLLWVNEVTWYFESESLNRGLGRMLGRLIQSLPTLELSLVLLRRMLEKAVTVILTVQDFLNYFFLVDQPCYKFFPRIIIEIFVFLTRSCTWVVYCSCLR
jgi:hypothetical protein